MKIQKNAGGQVGGGGGGQVGCERRIEVFVKIKKKWGGGRVMEPLPVFITFVCPTGLLVPCALSVIG